MEWSRGIHWNIFCKDFDVTVKISHMVKYRMIQEYGEFLPLEYQPPKKKVKLLNAPAHQEPNFEKWI